MTHNSLLFSFGYILCVGCMTSAVMAAPTVKKLGMSNNHVQSNNTGYATQKLLNSSKTSNLQRAPSLRLGTGGIKPVTANKSSFNTVSSGTKSTTNVDSNRLSVGKYIHTAGVNTGYIKQASAEAEAKAQSQDILSLMDQVSDLKTSVEAMNLDGYYNKDEVDALLAEINATVNNIDNSISNISNVNNATHNGTQIYNNKTEDYTSVSVIDEFPEDFVWDLNIDSDSGL